MAAIGQDLRRMRHVHSNVTYVGHRPIASDPADADDSIANATSSLWRRENVASDASKSIAGLMAIADISIGRRLLVSSYAALGAAFGNRAGADEEAEVPSRIQPWWTALMFGSIYPPACCFARRVTKRPVIQVVLMVFGFQLNVSPT